MMEKRYVVKGSVSGAVLGSVHGSVVKFRYIVLDIQSQSGVK